MVFSAHFTSRQSDCILRSDLLLRKATADVPVLFNFSGSGGFLSGVARAVRDPVLSDGVGLLAGDSVHTICRRSVCRTKHQQEHVVPFEAPLTALVISR